MEQPSINMINNEEIVYFYRIARKAFKESVKDKWQRDLNPLLLTMHLENISVSLLYNPDVRQGSLPLSDLVKIDSNLNSNT